jgi:OHCU decarboxylase
MTLSEFNHLTPDLATAEIFKCCSSTTWAKEMIKHRPFKNLSEMDQVNQKIWFSLSENDWLEAFSHHPQIGGNLNALKEKFQSTKTWSAGEQAGVNEAQEETLMELSDMNKKYYEKFGFVFLICATGKSALEMLGELKKRFPNTKETELKNASIEQSKITFIRINKLLEG